MPIKIAKINTLEMGKKNLLLLNIFLFVLIFSSEAQEWFDWRGPNRDGVWNESGIIEKFEADTIKTKWSVTVGPGYSGPTVAEGKVYLTDRLEAPDNKERILCFDAASGEKIWQYSYTCIYEGIGYPAGPRASVVLNEGKAYSLGSMGNLVCLNALSGNLIWSRVLTSDYNIAMPIWGLAATPLIVDDLLIVQASVENGGCIIAFNKNNGKEVWRALDEVASYSAPIIIQKDGNRVVIVWTEDSVTGLNPGTGEVYWQIPWKLKMGMGISTPVVYNDFLFLSCFYNGSCLIKLKEDYKSAEKVWQREGENERNTDALHCVMNTPVILDGYIYGVDSYGQLRCLELLTGDRVWEDETAVKKERWANIHFIQNKGKTWMFNEQGELIISELSPEGFEEISRAKLIEPTKKQLPRGVTWAHPAFAGKHVFIRNDHKLICADLSK